ncbi:MAG: tetratricopeptide repeat protein [Ferruginibacter sp.]|nr:tetratricopeptide repeat protein [Ferruginibacter sp.]
MERSTFYFTPLFILCCLFVNTIIAQPTWTLDPFGNEKKPEKYEDKILGSEKTATKKFGAVRHFIQNNVSHYNFYFNANEKLKAVLERAKLSQKDDYSKLLSFYSYSLANTAAQKTELDSVIYKCTAGILLHDLRSDWVDNMYLLIGKAYFFRKEFDSAAIAFQFINYNLFPRKKNEDDGRLIGTNNSAQYNVLSISNKEKRNIVQKTFTLPPSRNDALIWLTHTLIDQDQYGDASGLINILQNDPNLPKRLRNDLEEVSAYWFFKQKSYDSAAVHLEKGISTAETKPDKSRWEFLLGQLFEMTGDFDKASNYYARSARHTTDPVMDIYARLNDAKMFRNTGNEKELQKSIANLLKMAKKDKFEAYRDIIYYSTGQLSLQRPDTVNGIAYYRKSIYYNEANPLFKNKAYLQLGNLSYNNYNYREALNSYDSLSIPDSSLSEELAGIEDRRNSLRNVVSQMNIIQREDSLQLIAAMPAAERDALIKKLAKKYRKQSGQKENDDFSGNTIITFNNKNGEPQDLFATASSKGEWYFYNASLKSRGLGDFRGKWGKRENVDNWRRKSAIDAAANNNLNGNIDIDAPVDSSKINSLGNSKPLEYSFDGLMSNVPLTQEQLDSSNSNIANAYLALAKSFAYELDDYKQAINTYEEYLKRFPERQENGDVYLGLYYCYTKLGNTSKAAYYKNLLSSQFANSKASNMLNNPNAAQPGKQNPEVTQRYERIYNMFIEGDFANAVEEKKSADSLYGKNYWTPQLLYIESINYVRDRKDSQAISVLNEIITLYPASPLKRKAITMIDVLNRRAEIESYLTNLQITRAPEEERLILSDDKVVEVVKNEEKTFQPVKIESIKAPAVIIDSVQTPASMISGVYTWRPDKPHYIIMILNKVDPVYINEAKNAFTRYNKENYSSKKLLINKDVLDADRALLVTSSFENAADAIKYFDKVKKAAASEVSWLQASKYSFLVISETNLQLLKTNKDIIVYKILLNNQYPGKF